MFLKVNKSKLSNSYDLTYQVFRVSDIIKNRNEVLKSTQVKCYNMSYIDDDYAMNKFTIKITFLKKTSK